MSNNKLKFKIGDFKNLWVEKQLSGGTTFEINDDIQNGDICFAKLDTSSGNFVVKDSDNLYYSMPAPGELSFPLVGKGLNQAPEYSPIIKLQEISFIHSKDITQSMGSLVMGDISSANVTSAAEAILTLGNDIEKSATTKSAKGIMRIYGSGSGHGDIVYPNSSNSASFFLPCPSDSAKDNQSMFAIWRSSMDEGVGESAIPTYINENGEIVPCSGGELFSDLHIQTEGSRVSVCATIAGQVRAADIPKANQSQPGLMTGDTQFFNGTKYFYGNVSSPNLTVNPNVKNATRSIGNNNYPWNSLYCKAILIKGVCRGNTLEEGEISEEEEIIDGGTVAGTSGNSTASAPLAAYMTLGNIIPTAAVGGRYGKINLYGDGAYLTTIRTREGGATATGGQPYDGVQFLLPPGEEQNDKCYAVWSPEAAKAIGSSTQPVYIDATGKVVACDTYAGGTALTLNGTSKAKSTASIYAPTSSGTSTYILKSNGANTAPTWIQAVPVANGGTGITSWTLNRLIYASAATTLGVSSHYINNTKIAINSTTAPTENLYVNGSAKILGTTTLGDAYADTITLNGKVILVNNRTYGPSDPSSNTNLTTPTAGQIYFKLIS